MHEKFHIPILFAICSITLFVHLSSVKPPTIMEARNFISAREMTESGNYLIPTLNDNIRIRKPPLPVWLTAISAAIAGDPNNLTALRLPAAIAAMTMVFFLYGLIKDIFQNKRVAFYSSVVLATSYMFIEQGRVGSWDIFCNMFMLGSIWLLYRGFLKKSPKCLIYSGIFAGLSFLSKGPVAFYAMLLPFLAAFFISGFRFDKSLKGHLIIAVMIMVIISAWWPVYLYIKIPDIALIIAQEESNAWINRHNRPPWFYLHFPVFTGIWTVILIYALFHFKKFYQEFNKKHVALILTWILSAFILLSVIPEKKERYFLPVLPPLAVLISLALYRGEKLVMDQKGKVYLIFSKIQSIIIILAGIALPVLLWIFCLQRELMSTATFCFITILWMAFSGYWLYFLLIKKNYNSIFLASSLTMILFCASIWPYLQFFKYEHPDYDNLQVVKSNPAFEGKTFYTYSYINPIQLWQMDKKVIELKEGEQIPSENAVIISREDSLDYDYKFHINPNTKEEVLYFRTK